MLSWRAPIYVAMTADHRAANELPKQEATDEKGRIPDPALTDRRRRLGAILRPFAPATAISAVVIINSIAPGVAAEFRPPRELFIANSWPRPNATAPWDGEQPDAAVIANASLSTSSSMMLVAGPWVSDATLDRGYDASAAVDVGLPRPISVLARKFP
jgi:hypothetical protein